MIQELRWRGWSEPEVCRYAMALVCPDSLSIRVEGEPLLIAGGDDLVKLGPTDFYALTNCIGKKLIYIYPPFSIRRDPDKAWIMAQDIAQELADSDSS